MKKLKCLTFKALGTELVLELVDERLKGNFRTTKAMEGLFHNVHGGFLASLIDETMGNIILVRFNQPVVTGRLEIKYRKPVHVGVDLSVESWVERTFSKGYLVRTEVKNEQQTFVEATGMMVLIKVDERYVLPNLLE